MAPIRKRSALRTRAERSAQDPRGIYAPPSATSSATREPSATAAFHSLHHQSPANPLQRQTADVPTASSSFGTGDSDDFRLSKKDKRTVKHNVLLAKVRDAGIQKTNRKRRRPAKKLKADLGGLEDALPEVAERGAASASYGEASDDGDDWEGISAGSALDEGEDMKIEGLRKMGRRRQAALNGHGQKMTMKSLKNRPGAMKRKLRMEQSEMERFKRNMAQMVGSSVQNGNSAGTLKEGEDLSRRKAGGTPDQHDKWAALRRFIGGTMEKDKAFGAA